MLFDYLLTLISTCLSDMKYTAVAVEYLMNAIVKHKDVIIIGKLVDELCGNPGIEITANDVYE